MRKQTILLCTLMLCFALALCLMLALAVGCSKDKPAEPPLQTSNPIQMLDVGAIVEAVAPPVYTAPVTAPAVIDSMWLYGSFPLLSAVFGSREPEALYTNIDKFKMMHGILSTTLMVDENNHIIPGVYVDSYLVDVGQQVPDWQMLHFTATVTALTGATTVPAAAQAVIGASVDMDYLVTIAIDSADMPDFAVQVGMTFNDTVQTIFMWNQDTGTSRDETMLTYASLDPRDSSFTFKGVGFVQHAISTEYPNGDQFRLAYSITSEANSDFAYRMSYISTSDQWSNRYAFLGGGNKDTEFALIFRPYTPANGISYDPQFARDQVFGPNYTEGTGLISTYSQYLADALMYPYDAIPSAMFASPWAQ